MKLCGLIKVFIHSFLFFLIPEKQFPIKIPYTEYHQQLTTDNVIQVTALCHVEGGIQVLVQRDITLDNPAIDIEVNCCPFALTAVSENGENRLLISTFFPKRDILLIFCHGPYSIAYLLF